MDNPKPLDQILNPGFLSPVPNTTPIFQPLQQKQPAPANKTTPNPSASASFPSLPVTPPNQVYLHPEHAANYKPPEANGENHKTIIFGIILGVLTAGIIFIWFFLVPRTLAVSFAKNAKEIILSGDDKTYTLNKSLKSLYAAESNQNPTPATLNSTQVLGAQTNLEDQISVFSNGSNLLDEKKTIKEKGFVEGFSTPSSDPNKGDRDRRDLAVAIANKASEAQKTNDELSVLLQKPLPANTNSIQDELKGLNVDTANYIDQATKTANYYIDVSDTSIDLSNLATATSIDNIINHLNDMKEKYVNYTKNGNLPDKMDKFNADLVDMLDVLIGLYTNVKNNPKPTPALQQALVTNYKNRINNDAVASVTDEISFWKNNYAISNYDSLSSRQTEVLKTLDQLKNNNNFFILDWMGVS